ncbi:MULTISPECIES: hypothetical protein [Microbacterium]|uniref:Cell wall protein n=1 Tax=Microbacterium wangchenii TaxID=2541726 RepID=A0ABX5SPR7_9MICO|nr:MULTISPECIES: hypothetical protein [Microbacterium]MCK6068058.1 hypothetical protein [Microbacterium sp. EYE_512]QBR87812.1 hypothetical protein E4K62_03330 [Microbacterium wangchenii]TFV84066.1 hypothetical protein E4V99_03045 [Microbacterium sp. dk485]TXK16105.1 hypothetical protein FVP99_11565 [Microbacterium wangchenii]
MRSIAAAVFVGVLMGAPVTAGVATESRYTPVDPSTATLAGSAVAMECRSGDPWLDYRVQLTAADDESVAATALLVVESGGRTETVSLGEVTEGTTSGEVRVPADAAALAAADPSASATIQLEPSGAPALRVPLASSACAMAALPVTLPFTGLEPWVPALGAVGVALLAAGIAVSMLRRRRES